MKPTCSIDHNCSYHHFKTVLFSLDIIQKQIVFPRKVQENMKKGRKVDIYQDM